MDWSPEIETGLAAIDGQHRRLFDLAASLEHLDNPVHVMGALFELSNYVNVHFHEEEALLAVSSYPDVEAHIAQHDEFRQMMARMLEDARHLNLDQIAERVCLLVKDVLHRHIQQLDFDYVPYVKSIAPK